jgi:hypothetical protein
MANPNPVLHTIFVGAKQIVSTITGKPLCAAITVRAESGPAEGEGERAEAKSFDGYNLLVRPGDYLQFELGELDFPVDSKPSLRIEWKNVIAREWRQAPLEAGKKARVPPRAGFAGKRLSWKAILDIGGDLRLPCQSRSARGTTLIEIDPDVIVEEC